MCGNVLEIKPLFITIEKFTKNEKLADGETSLYLFYFLFFDPPCFILII